MPTNLDRIQCLLQPDTFAVVRTLAKHNRRTNSAMCAELIEAAIKLPKYKGQIDEADVQVPAKDDPRQAVPQTQVKSYKEYLTKEDAETTETFGLDQIPEERLAELHLLIDALQKVKQVEKEG